MKAYILDISHLGFLWQLLCEIAHQHGNSMRENGCQTDGTQLSQDSLGNFLCVFLKYSSVGITHPPPPPPQKKKFLKLDSSVFSVERFRKLDEHYATMSDSYKGGVAEERILAYQRMLDERSRTEYNLEVNAFSLALFSTEASLTWD